jgi:hypothetical protein
MGYSIVYIINLNLMGYHYDIFNRWDRIHLARRGPQQSLTIRLKTPLRSKEWL